MPVIPPDIETEIRNKLTKILVEPEESEAENVYYLDKHGINLHFKINYQKYYRKGEVEHGSEIIFRLDNRDDIVKSDISAIEKHIDNILKSKLSYNGDFNLDNENDEYVFMDEIIQKP